MLSCSSVQLFLDRARIARPDFQLNARNAEAVAAICTRLEGLPLALELAAARINILSAAQILNQLKHRFAFLVSKRRDIAPRHRSLYAALQWSYDLLPPDLQTFFCRLSVFRGGFTIEAAQDVCEAPDALGMVENLRAHSLLFAEETGAEMRFRLLETMREWGQEHLEAEAQATLARRHADFYLLLAERGEPDLFGAEQALWFARLDADNDNLEAALEAGLSCPATAAMGLRLANALWHYWQVCARIQTGENWLRRGLEANPNAQTDLRAKALLGLGYLAREQHRHTEAEAFLRQALRLYEQQGDIQGQGSARGFLSTLTTVDRQEQEMLVNRSLEQCRESGYRQGEAFALFKLADYAPDPNTRISMMEQSRVLFAELGNWRRLAIVSGELAYLLRWHKDDYAAALRLCEDAERLSRKVGDVAAIAHALWHTGDIVNIQGDYARTVACFEEAIELCETHHIQGIALPMYLWALASAHWKQGQFAPAQFCLQQCRETL